LRLEFWIDDIDKMPHLVGNGLLAINPPYRLEDEAKILLPFLAQTLAASKAAGSAVAAIRPS
jgi:23S rRNA (adenine2030-N6)-methyltransferase